MAPISIDYVILKIISLNKKMYFDSQQLFCQGIS